MGKPPLQAVPRRLWLDAIATGMLAFGLIAGTALLGQEPPFPTPINFPAPSNPLGQFGAWISQSLLQAFGVSAFLGLFAWFSLLFGIYLRITPGAFLFRLFGWSLIIISASGLLDLWRSSLGAISEFGPGGKLAKVLEEWNFYSTLSGGEKQFACWILLVLGSLFSLTALWMGFFRGMGKLLSLLVFLIASGVRTIAWAFRLLVHRKPPAALKLATDTALAPEEQAPMPSAIELPGRDIIPIFHHGKQQGKAPQAKVESPSQSADSATAKKYQIPPLSLLEDPIPISVSSQEQELRERAILLEKTFLDFGLNIRVAGINTGPVITQFEIALETGLRVHKVTRLNDDIALNLKVPSVRIVAPIPGKNTVGVEVPNEIRAEVRLKEVLQAIGPRLAKLKIPLFLGKDAEGRPLVYDLADMPHLLIAGSTGTGKSVCMNTIILSMLMTRRPDEVRMIMIDPKVVELSNYTKIPHMMHPVVHDMKKAEAILAWAVEKMEERYEILRRARVRNIAGYNELGQEEILDRVELAPGEDASQFPGKMPFIVIFIDEMADLMMTMKKEVEGHIIRLAQKSRAAGIHLVVATQKPTVDVITGLIKSNLPARICFKVVNKSDSRVVLDEMGADKLLGKGDMLFLPPGTSSLIRAQGTFASDREITRVVETLEGDPCYAQELMTLETREERENTKLGSERLSDRDELYESAVDVVIREGRGSVSLLQRTLGVGYGRAARLIDYMAEDGIVGAYNGSSAREVVMSLEQWEQHKRENQSAVSNSF